MGAKRQRWTEYLRIAVCLITVVPLKAVGAFCGVFIAYFGARVGPLLPKAWREPFTEVVLKFGARIALLSVGFVKVRTVKVQTDAANGHVASNTQGKRKLKRAQTKGRESRTPVAVGAVVSNHVGWADILIHMARWLPSFVARDATARLPFIGVTSTAMGCLFVQRERDSTTVVNKEFMGVGARVKQRMQQISNGTAKNRHPLLLFPEGTTTNGDYLLRFKTGAFLAGVPVQPIILKYGPSRISPAWETIGGAWHIFLMLCTPLHSVTVYELPVYIPSEEEKADPHLYANNVRQFMLEHSALKESDASYDDKRMYHAMLQRKELPIIHKKTN